MAVRTVIGIAALLVLATCATQTGSPVAVTRESLERRINREEAQAFVLADTDRAVQLAQAQRATTNSAEAQSELKILAAHRHDLTSRLESFLADSSPSDELWVYRTHTSAGRGGESGLALLRNGRIIDHLTIAICD
jgi:hypothetical protein